MAAGEDQPQALVLHHRALLVAFLAGCGQRAFIQAVPGHRPLTAQLVDRLPPRGEGQPGAGVGWHAVAPPRGGRCGERLGHRVLGGLQVAEPPGQAGHHGGPLVAERALKRGSGRGSYSIAVCQRMPSRTGRTSTVP